MLRNLKNCRQQEKNMQYSHWMEETFGLQENTEKFKDMVELGGISRGSIVELDCIFKIIFQN